MTGPPADRLEPHTVSLGSRDKQPRAFDGARPVRVLGENGTLIDVCTPERLRGYLAAANVEVHKRTDGSIKYIRLLPLGDDRGHTGERHGQSTITTERVRNDWGGLIGGDTNLQHKRNCTAWGAPAVRIKTDNPSGHD